MRNASRSNVSKVKALVAPNRCQRRVVWLTVIQSSIEQEPCLDQAVRALWRAGLYEEHRLCGLLVV